MFEQLSVVLRAHLLASLMKLPGRLTRPLGFGVVEVDGQPVSDTLRWLLRLLVLEPVDTPHQAKRAIYDYLGTTSVAGAVHDVDVVDHEVMGNNAIPIRIYRPKGSRGVLPTIFWVHGGGFVVGSLTSHDVFCRRLCAEANVVVVAADYRLGPEHPFPAPQEDIITVWRWVREHAEAERFDPARLCLGGDSAGGNLTAMLCQQISVDERPAYQVLCYPSTDSSKNSPSRERWSKGYLLDLELIDWFNTRYCSGEDMADPRISPLLAPTLDDQPPAIMITAGMDPLVDEGLAYADRLEAAGVNVTRLHYAPLIHGFITLFGALPEADVAVAEMTAVIGQCVHGLKEPLE